MRKLFVFIGVIAFSQILAHAAACPLTSYENRLEYRYNDSMWLICDYQGGRLQARFFHNDFELFNKINIFIIISNIFIIH